MTKKIYREMLRCVGGWGPLGGGSNADGCVRVGGMLRWAMGRSGGVMLRCVCECEGGGGMLACVSVCLSACARLRTLLFAFVGGGGGGGGE